MPEVKQVFTVVRRFCVDGALDLSDHPKPANGYHLKTGQRE